jgi:hypothetical protein
MAIRFRVLGLPPGQFMAPGKLYVAQVRYNANDLPLTEQDFVDLERLNRAAHVSIEQIRTEGSRTWYAVPDGADKFHLSSVFSPPPGMMAVDASGGHGSIRKFLEVASYADDGGFPGAVMEQLWIPYTGGGLTSGTLASNSTWVAGDPSASSDPTDVAAADGTMVLVAGAFGVQDGLILEVDYSSVIEAVPTPDAPAGVDAAIQLPNTPAMDAIYRSVATLAQARGALFMSDGDAAIGAAAGAVAGAVTSVSARIAEMRPVRAEGFFDWFNWMNQAQIGKRTRGIGWNFTGSESRGARARAEGVDPRTITQGDIIRAIPGIGSMATKAHSFLSFMLQK